MKIKGVNVQIGGVLYAFGAGIMLPSLAWLTRQVEMTPMSVGDALALLWQQDVMRFALAAYCMAMASMYWKPAQGLLYWQGVFQEQGEGLNSANMKGNRESLRVCCTLMLLFYTAAFAALPGPFFPLEGWPGIAKSALAFGLAATGVFPIMMTTRCMVASWQAHKSADEGAVGA